MNSTLLKMLAGTMIAALFLLAAPAEAKFDFKKLKIDIVNSLEELQQLQNINDRHIILDALPDQVWCGDARDTIVIENGRHFVLDGGENSPTIYGHTIVLRNCKDVLVRNLVVRLGVAGFADDDTNASFVIENSEDIELENCSFTWGTSESLAIVDSEDVTVSKCIIGEAFSGGSACLVRGSKDVEIEKCLLARCVGGCPNVDLTGENKTDLRMEDNVIFNYRDYGFRCMDSDGRNDKFKCYLSDNHFIAASDAGPAILVDAITKRGKLYLKLKNNRDGDGNAVAATLLDDDRVKLKDKGLRKKITKVAKIVEAVGPRIESRSATDQRLVNAVLAREFDAPALSEVELPEFSLFNIAE